MANCINLADVKKILKEAGINPTAQRIAISCFVLCEANHPTAEDVRKWAEDNFPMLARATVYNTLHSLVRVGVLKEVRLSAINKVVYDTNTSYHHHFFDTNTGTLEDICPSTVDIDLSISDEIKIDSLELLIKGTKHPSTSS